MNSDRVVPPLYISLLISIVGIIAMILDILLIKYLGDCHFFGRVLIQMVLLLPALGFLLTSIGGALLLVLKLTSEKEI